MEEPQRRGRTVLSDQLSAAALELPSSSNSTAAGNPSNLRDLLTVRQEEDLLQPPAYQLPGRRGAGVSLGTVLACENHRNLSSTGLAAGAPPPTATAAGSRTLLDIIRDEDEAVGGGAVYDGIVVGGSDGGHDTSWRSFQDHLRIRRASAAWQTSGGGNPVDGISAAADRIPSPASADSPSGTLPPEGRDLHAAAVSNPSEATRQTSSGEQAEGSHRGAAAPSPVAPGEAQQQQQQPPIRVSLMALLEQADRQGDGPGFAVSALLGPEEEEEEEEEEGSGGWEREEEGEGGEMYVKCCVCMVRHKGAAFIPCGHTFCRRCSRELWVSRGNCPLCNGFILEILDIF